MNEYQNNVEKGKKTFEKHTLFPVINGNKSNNY